MRELLGLLRPAAVIETGTFRGISAEWLAEHFSGLVLSCEKEKLYFLQAQARLSGRKNVDLRLEDSRQFLREILSKLSKNESILVYLDAHWERDLPLRDEIASIFASQAKAVVVIDDFRVPDDPGYGWDDYGIQGSIELALLDGVIPDDAQLFFPTMKSDDETGARRGCCIVASDSAHIIARSVLLRGNTLAAWLRFSVNWRSRRVSNPLRSQKPGMITRKSRMVKQVQPRIHRSSIRFSAASTCYPRSLPKLIMTVRHG